MKKFILNLLVNGIALYAAVALVSGIVPQNSNWFSFLWLALIFGLINAILKPILHVVGCPFIILTLGLGALLINSFLFYLAGQIGTRFGVGFTVAGFWPAFFGALVVSIVSFILNIFIKDDDKHKRD
ncbi:MAG: phage holin family protein [Anaerolineaceae bacterium]|nr:phage holin family protein [Anaerolineaceae bacterium]